MTKVQSLLAAVVLTGGVSFFSIPATQAQPNPCFLGCHVLAHSCMESLRTERRACKSECKAMAPGRGRGHCQRDCAGGPLLAKASCRIERDRCRAECLDGAQACHFECAAEARECSVMARTDGRDCRMMCRSVAEEAAAACAEATDPQACLEGVAEERGMCFGTCGTTQGTDLEACGQGFMGCKDACRPDDPNEPPDGNEP